MLKPPRANDPIEFFLVRLPRVVTACRSQEVAETMLTPGARLYRYDGTLADLLDSGSLVEVSTDEVGYYTGQS